MDLVKRCVRNLLYHTERVYGGGGGGEGNVHGK